MSVRLRDVQAGLVIDLRYEPTAKRVRAMLDGRTVVDSTTAILVWEPRRVVPSYAVPEQDIDAELLPVVKATAPDGGPAGFSIPDLTRVPVLDPRIPFSVHTAAGEAVELRVAGTQRTVEGFRPADADLAGQVILDFSGFDRWLDEDEEIVAHPRDPFGRIDICRTSRHVEIWERGELLADTTRAMMLFETLLPVRYYLPADDVLVPLTPSATRTACAYKGHARYLSAHAQAGVLDDLIWTYPEPLPDALRVKDYLAFFNEKVDLVIDGTPRPRPVTPWS